MEQYIDEPHIDEASADLHDKVQRLVFAIADLYAVRDITIDVPQKDHVRFRGTLLCDLETQFDTLRQRFEQFGYTPLIRDQDGEAVLIGLPQVFRPKPTNPLINLILFIATIFSTLLVGAWYNDLPPTYWSMQSISAFLLSGWPFSLSILLILGAHELGHYFAARFHKVHVTLPYFIPVPTIIGTMGAFIAIREPIKNKRALFDIGASGPLAGLVFAIPIFAIGLATSELAFYIPSAYVGSSIMTQVMMWAVLGEAYPAQGVDVALNAVAFAGWCGLLVTMMNLLPVGQLDGGHIAYVLFGKRARLFFWPAVLALMVITIYFRTTFWVLWILLLFIFGRFHAEPLDDVTDVGLPRKLVGVGIIILFLLIFIPSPFGGASAF